MDQFILCTALKTCDRALLTLRATACAKFWRDSVTLTQHPNKAGSETVTALRRDAQTAIGGVPALREGQPNA